MDKHMCRNRFSMEKVEYLVNIITPVNCRTNVSPEIHVPPHNNYSESVYLVSDDGILLDTNRTCQMSDVTRDLNRAVKGLPLPKRVPQSPTYHVVKARKTRITQSNRESLMSVQNSKCKNQAVTKTQDFKISEEDYKKMQEGGLVTVIDDGPGNPSCARQCSSVGPQACGYTGWTNPATGVGFSFHQVSYLCHTCMHLFFAHLGSHLPASHILTQPRTKSPTFLCVI